MNPTIHLKQIIRDAVSRENFDTAGARICMSPLGRIPKRPSDMQGGQRCGSVMIILFAVNTRLHVILTHRREDLRLHPGQISFPGGRREPDEDALTCALRETHEEIGIRAETLEIIGKLDPAYILASDFLISPFIAWHSGIPICTPAPHEVADILAVPIARLNAPDARTFKNKKIRGTMKNVPGFLFSEHHIWGATAMLLQELIERIKAAGWQE